MATVDCGPPAGGKLTKWPAVSKRLDSTDVEYNVKLMPIPMLIQSCAEENGEKQPC